MKLRRVRGHDIAIARRIKDQNHGKAVCIEVFKTLFSFCAIEALAKRGGTVEKSRRFSYNVSGDLFPILR